MATVLSFIDARRKSLLVRPCHRVAGFQSLGPTDRVEHGTNQLQRLDYNQTLAKQGLSGDPRDTGARKVIALPEVCGLLHRYERVPSDIRFGGTEAPVPMLRCSVSSVAEDWETPETHIQS